MKRAVIFLSVACALGGDGLQIGCTPAPQARPDTDGAIDLVSRFSTGQREIVAAGNSGSFERHSSVTRGGRREDAMTLVAPVAIRASLAGLSGRYMLRLLAAPVFNFGDGLQMDVFVGSAGDSRHVYGRYFDAGRKAVDRTWNELEVALDLSGAGDAYLEIQVSGGPQGDLVADWLALAEVRLNRAQTAN